MELRIALAIIMLVLGGITIGASMLRKQWLTALWAFNTCMWVGIWWVK